jgi:RNA processing factor Prp31
MVERKLKKSVENPVKKTGENLRDLQEEVKEDSVTMGLNNIKKQMEEESHEVDKLRIDLIKLMNQVDENSLDLENRANALKSRLFLRE